MKQLNETSLLLAFIVRYTIKFLRNVKQSIHISLLGTNNVSYGELKMRVFNYLFASCFATMVLV